MPKTKKTPDYLRAAAGHLLSDFPEKWSGEKIVDYLSENPESYSEKITPWYPFEDFSGELIAEYIENLADSFKDFYLRKV